MTHPIYERITRPTLVIRKSQALKNIAKVLDKTASRNILCRPHFKTHQSVEVGSWYREAGIKAITVSSVEMAEKFARDSWTDIIIAFPYNPREAAAIDALARKVQLGILLESTESAAHLAGHTSAKINAWIKIDTGYHRTGILWDNFEMIAAVANALKSASHLTLTGLLAHAGHTYNVKHPGQVDEIHQSALQRLENIKSHLSKEGYAPLKISLGDTPTASLVEDLGGLDEFRPGNFIFYDLMQEAIGACSEADISLAVACPIVAKHRERLEVVIYGGAVHLSKDFLSDGRSKSFGRIAFPSGDGWTPSLENTALVRLSQEHGIIKTSNALFAEFSIGDLIVVLPVHSCLAANLLDGYMSIID